VGDRKGSYSGGGGGSRKKRNRRRRTFLKVHKEVSCMEAQEWTLKGEKEHQKVAVAVGRRKIGLRNSKRGGGGPFWFGRRDSLPQCSSR